jgi:hypothetical protein
MNCFIYHEILVDLQIKHSCLSGFRVTESADSEGLDDATAVLKRSVSVVCLLLLCLSFSNFSFSLYICIITNSLSLPDSYHLPTCGGDVCIEDGDVHGESLAPKIQKLWVDKTIALVGNLSRRRTFQNQTRPSSWGLCGRLVSFPCKKCHYSKAPD